MEVIKGRLSFSCHFVASTMKTSLLKTALSAGIPFGILMGLLFGLTSGLTQGLILGCLSGLLFGGLIAAFVQYQSGKMSSRNSDFEGETVLLEGPANHFLNAESRGGWLTLTPSRLAFRSHGANVQNEPLDIMLSAIAKASPSNIFGIIPNGLTIRTNEGKETFVVTLNKRWAREISAQLNPTQTD